MRRLLPLATASPWLAWLCAAVCLGRGALAEAQVRDPRLSWRTIETPHFSIHYHTPLAHTARRVAAVAERAHARLSTWLAHEPAARVQVVVTDDSDDANGSATALPYDTLRVYAQAPDDLSPLAEYDDWLTMLVTHEHTHIEHLGQAGGVPAFVNALLGRVYMPNHIQPRWFLEGLAVHAESEFTSGGRLRSSQWDMYLRMDALEDRFWDLDQLSSTADRWPHGHAAYLYGSYFVRHIAEHHGREALARIAREYSRAPVPYGLNRVAARATGQGFIALYDEFLQARRAHDRAVLAEVDALGRREGTRLTHHGELARAPRYLPDGRLIYMRGDNRQRSVIAVVDPRDGRALETLARVQAGGEASAAPDGRSLVFSRTAAHRDVYFFADLFRRRLEDGHEERLTHGLRAREPDVSPDGGHVVFTTSRAGTTRLMIAELRDIEGTMRPLLETERFEQVYTPRFSPDGRTVAASVWRRGGYRDVVLIDLDTGLAFDLTRDRAQDTGPVFSPDGALVYFSSDRTGIANVYAYRRATGELRQITNVIAGAYQPAVSPDGARLVYVGYTSFGFDLFAMDLEAQGFRAAPTYADTRPASADDTALWTAWSAPYDPLPTLYPRSYQVDVTPDSFGPTVGVSAAGRDAAEFHDWSVRLGVGLVRGNLAVDAAYTYSGLPLAISARGFRHVRRAGGLELAGRPEPWFQESMGGEVGVSYAFPRAFRRDALSLAYAFTYTRAAEPFSTRDPDPNDAPPQLPERGRFATLRFGWSHSDAERYLYDISPSNGRTMGASAALSEPALGSQYRVLTLATSLTQYVPLWAHHVLALRYAAGVSLGDGEHLGVFQLGGFPQVSLVEGLADPVILGGQALRGYAAGDRAGSQFHLVQLEYRFPIVRLNRGVLTLPVYLNRLWATVFADAGDAFSSAIDLARFRVGVGAELHLDFTVFYILPLSLRLGYGRGLGEGGLDQFYGHLGVPF